LESQRRLDQSDGKFLRSEREDRLTGSKHRPLEGRAVQRRGGAGGEREALE
jgi:hypothetical protein